jgi:hypothetical protein
MMWQSGSSNGLAHAQKQLKNNVEILFSSSHIFFGYPHLDVP